jgi:hypothetical protein
MIAELIAILNQHGRSVVDEILDNLSNTGTSASGKTANSLKYEVTTQGDKTTLRIIGKPFFAVVETGRKPTPEYVKPSRQFVASIREWLKAKGGEEGAAYAIAKTIHQKGTKLYQEGGRTDIFSNVINDSLIDKISQDLLSKFAEEFLQNVVATFNGNNRRNSSDRT